jgi:predicted CoA-binding protein
MTGFRTTRKAIDSFFNQKHIAVAGVSRDKKKFGSIIYKTLEEKGFTVYPVNPNMESYEGKTCFATVEDLPKAVTALVINTKPDVTKELVSKARAKGIAHIWLQQGSADKATLNELEGTDIIGKECLLMFAEPVKGIHGFHRWLKKSFGSLPQ